MNRACAYPPCRRVVRIDAHPLRQFCSKVCKGREAYRLYTERQAEGLVAPRKSRQLPPAPLTCQLPTCGGPIAAGADPRTLYCSPVCRSHAHVLAARAKRAERAIQQRQEEARNRPAPPPVRVLLPALAKPCEGCRHMRIQPLGERGVECAANRFRSCNPLGSRGPLLKEAI